MKRRQRWSRSCVATDRQKRAPPSPAGLSEVDRISDISAATVAARSGPAMNQSRRPPLPARRTHKRRGGPWRKPNQKNRISRLRQCRPRRSRPRSPPRTAFGPPSRFRCASFQGLPQTLARTVIAGLARATVLFANAWQARRRTRPSAHTLSRAPANAVALSALVPFPTSLWSDLLPPDNGTLATSWSAQQTLWRPRSKRRASRPPFWSIENAGGPLPRPSRPPNIAERRFPSRARPVPHTFPRARATKTRLLSTNSPPLS